MTHHECMEDKYDEDDDSMAFGRGEEFKANRMNPAPQQYEGQVEMKSWFSSLNDHHPE